jgi:hypothetical protein
MHRITPLMDRSIYRAIQPPFNLNFYEMSKNELKAYFKWFQDITPERIAELASAVKSSPGFENWKPDLSPDSLNALGDWFATQIEVRARTQEEIDTFNAQTTYPIERSDRELTNRTISFAMDIGMYLSQVFLRNHPSLKWEQLFGSKRFIDYGQPVLSGFAEKAQLNPVSIIVTLAYGLLKGNRTGRRLRELYDIWSKSIGKEA